MRRCDGEPRYAYLPPWLLPNFIKIPVPTWRVLLQDYGEETDGLSVLQDYLAKR